MVIPYSLYLLYLCSHRYGGVLAVCVSSPPELASDGLKGRVFEVAQADLQGDEVAYRKFRLVAEDVQGKHVLTNFHGMTLTTDKLKSLVKKWQVWRMKGGK